MSSNQPIKVFLGVLLLCVTLEFVSRISILPGVSESVRGIWLMFLDGSLRHNVQVSSARWLIGWSLGASLGILAGFLTGRVPIARVAFEGFFVIIRAIPFICLVPISLLIFGLGESGKFFLIGWASATVSWVIVHDATRQISPHFRWRATSLGASQLKWFFDVLVPISAGAVFSALRASLSIGLIVVAVAEMSGVYEQASGFWWSGGLGYRMFRALDEARNELLMGSVIVFAMLGIVGDVILQGIWWAIGVLRFRLRQSQIRTLVRTIRNSDEDVSFEWGSIVELSIRDLEASYGDYVVFKGLNATVQAGETVSIVGPSGCGKTTLLRAIGRFVDGRLGVTGRISLGHQAVEAANARIGFVMQEAPVFSHLTVWDNIRFGSWTRGRTQEDIARVVLYLLREFELTESAWQRAESLSGGQRQRVALATAVANRPDVLLLDEPFGALDAITRRRLQEFYNQKVSGKVCAVFVTHDLEEALIVGDRVRTGITDSSKEFRVDKKGMPAQEWELSEDFSRQRVAILKALEQYAKARE